MLFLSAPLLLSLLLPLSAKASGVRCDSKCRRSAACNTLGLCARTCCCLGGCGCLPSLVVHLRPLQLLLLPSLLQFEVLLAQHFLLHRPLEVRPRWLPALVQRHVARARARTVPRYAGSTQVPL